MSIEPIATKIRQLLPPEYNPSLSENGRSFQEVLEEQGLIMDIAANPGPTLNEEGGQGPSVIPMPHPVEEESTDDPTAIRMPHPVAEDEEDEAILQPMLQALSGEAESSGALGALMAMAGGGDWTYNRDNMMREADTFLTALGVDHHDRLEFTEMFPPEGAELDLVRMGKLVTKFGDIMAGRVDAGKMAQLLPNSGMSEAEVQSWLTNMGVEYQRTGELMKAKGEAGGEFNSILWEENLTANLVNTLPDKLSITDLAGLLAETVGESTLYSAMGALIGDLA